MRSQLLVAALALGLSCAAFSSDLKDFVGQYVVTDIVGYTDISGGEPVARDTLGKTLTISSNEISFSGEPCKPFNGFVVKEVDTASALNELYGPITPLDVGLGPKAVLLDSENCIAIFKVSEYRVLFSWDGVIVRAIRDYKPPAHKAPKRKQE